MTHSLRRFLWWLTMVGYVGAVISSLVELFHLDLVRVALSLGVAAGCLYLHRSPD